MKLEKANSASRWHDRLRRLASLKITVTLLVFSFLLVFFGTLAQVELGISIATIQFFRSWFVYWQPESLPFWRFPVILPGAWLVGTLLLLNLTAAFIVRFRWKWSKAGLLMAHLGIIILLVGELLTGVFQVETYLQLDEGETRSFTVSRDEPEIVIRRIGENGIATVYAFDDQLLEEGQTLTHPELPLDLHLREVVPNAGVSMQPEAEGWQPAEVTLGFGTQLFFQPRPRETELNRYDQPLAIASISSGGEELGTLLLSTLLNSTQQVTVDGTPYEFALRPRRYQHNFAFTLIDFRHDRYPGTNKPKNFSSRLRLVNEASREDREVLIKMNEPLRYAGLSFYQHSFDNADTTTILQVVRNPARWLPYIACGLVFAGLLFQFALRLNRHERRS
ncbi:MAG: cytochrome c biogenesis protein ResB [Opitutales bacterium]